jgi:uncharacterized protein YceK
VSWPYWLGQLFFKTFLMRLKVSVLMVCASVLAGCASVKDVTTREPVFFGSTARSAADYVQCVDSAWKGLGVNATRQPIHNGFELVVEGYGGVDSVLTATTWQAKTDARLFMRIQRNNTTLAEAANLCL